MGSINWVPILEKPIQLEVQTQVTPTKGNLVYEYNPFRNYRLTQNMYEYKDLLYTLQELKSNFGITLSDDNKSWLLNNTEMVSQNLPELREPGELVDFITDELLFDINHPVSIIPQYSYDGSVNLILNDGVNTPKLINSRFSATGRNTYEVVDRKGNNDANIYDLGDAFLIDTSLYKSVINIPKITYKGCVAGGNLKIGNYFFYFKLADADGNETDFIGESGLVSVFIGFDDPQSVTTGQKHENSFKSVQFILSNLDIAYDHVKVYYSRSTAEGSENACTEYKQIDRKYIINNAGMCNVLVTGNEGTNDITVADINLHYNIVDSAKTLASCQNMLFLGNVHKPEIPYEELADLSLRFLPYLKEERYPLQMDLEYDISSTANGYYNDKYIYEKTGYWTGELYRFGVVYIMPNGELSPVFNIRGGIDVSVFNATTNTLRSGTTTIVGHDGQYSYYPVFDSENKRSKIIYTENNYYVVNNDANTNENKCNYENVKGVVRFKSNKDANIVYGVDIRTDDDTILELKKYVKGYFFVRQKRIPTVIAQGITIGIDLESHCPTIPTAGGILDTIQNSLSDTHVTTENINGVNYISEGFLSRYTFKFKQKKSALFGKIGKIAAAVVVVAAIAVACVFTYGAASAAIPAGATAAGALIASATAGGLAVAGTATAIGIGTAIGIAVASVVTAAAGGLLEMRYAYSKLFRVRKLDGRNTKCPSGYTLAETSDSRKLIYDFNERIIIKDGNANKVLAIICPDFEVNLPYYNQIFTGNEHYIQTTIMLGSNGDAGRGENYFSNDERHFYIPDYVDKVITIGKTFKVIAVLEDLPIIGMGDFKYRSRAGNAEEAWRYESIGEDFKSKYTKLDENNEEDSETINNRKINSDIVRGIYGPYLAFNDEDNFFSPAETVNIYIPKYSESNLGNYIDIRMHDDSIYYAISDRFAIKDSDNYLVSTKTNIIGSTSEYDNGYLHIVYRGDCYICQFTHRVIRNFNSPSAPYNDEIIDEDTWKDNYNPNKPEKYSEINLGDVNAVPLGMWVTFRIRSNNNLNIRTLDGSNIDEATMTGHPHGYYPYLPMDVSGHYKKSESQVFNNGFNVKLSDRYNFLVPDVPYIKNWFGTRIMYSDVHINDAYLNGFRVFRGQNYLDYTREYGEIVKLVSLNSNLLCVFEHGIALIPVNERAVAGAGSGGNVYINTSKVLPENPRIISNTFGSQWADSILKVPTITGGSESYVYGVDTVAKKIWRTDGATIQCISDFKVLQFLNENITLGERELTPILGIRNVKTFYNAFKHDVMFTFYDNTYGFEEKVWNLCWNELMNNGQGQFVTFYSWVPSVMENINNIPFSFDRNVSKWIAKLGTTHNESSFADGVTLTNVLINNYFITDEDNSSTAENGEVVDNFSFDVNILLENGSLYKKTFNLKNDTMLPTTVADDVCTGLVGILGIKNRVLPDTTLFYQMNYSLQRDPWGNYKNFDIKEVGTYEIPADLEGLPTKYPGLSIVIYGLYFKQRTNLETDFELVYTGTGDNAELFYDKRGSDYDYFYLKKGAIGPETLMSELYYRNKAGHSYADSESNKIKYQIQTSYASSGALDPLLYYNIYYVVDYVLDNWYIPKLDDADMPEDERNSLQLRITDAKALLTKLIENTAGDGEKMLAYGLGSWLLKENGGPFPDDALVYLGTPPKLYSCSGNLGHLVSNPERHAPFTAHYIQGSYVEEVIGSRKKIEDLPIFKNMKGQRPMLSKKDRINEDKLVTQLMIKADINIIDDANTQSFSDNYFNLKANYINAGYYESTIAVTTKWNMQFLTSDFWKHGQAGLIDIADDIYPTYWYGKQHPFEFECIVVNDPSVHKIFTNLELIANKAKPESFHYEVIGEAYDFAKDKVNMYFRQEAIKALWQYNGADITYDRNFLKVEPKQNTKSADLVRTYYARTLSVNEIESYYRQLSRTPYNYDHLSGGEIVYYPNRLEFRVWNHVKAVDIDDQKDTSATSFGGRGLIAANMRYLEDRWKITINPLLVVYRNEYASGLKGSTWADSYDKSHKLPPISIYNSPIPDMILQKGNIDIPGQNSGEVSEYEKSNALYQLYDLTNYLLNGNYSPLDTVNWLNTNATYKTDFGVGLNRRETDIRDKFLKVRIRYSGEELAVIDWLNTIYQISYA